MYRYLLILHLVIMVEGCTYFALPTHLQHWDAADIPSESINIFSETIIRMRSDLDDTMLDLKEGQRLGERSFNSFRASWLIAYFDSLRGSCQQSDRSQRKLTCVVKKRLAYNGLGLSGNGKFRCANLVMLIYEFEYPSFINSNSVWSSMTFDARQEECKPIESL